MRAARGTLGRLEALEERERSRVAAVEAAKDQQAEQAMLRLSQRDHAAMREFREAADAGGEWWAEVSRVWELIQADHLPGGEAARAWGDRCAAVGDGVPYPTAPMGAAAYFEAEGARCEEAEVFARTPGAALPDGVRAVALEACARWAGSDWRYMAALARVIGEGVSG